MRSPLGRVLGREWHRDTAYGVAARGYIRSGRSDDEWISSHLELRGEDGELLVRLRLGVPARRDGEVNIGVGTLATARRPAEVRLRSLLEHYADARRDDWQLDGPVRAARVGAAADGRGGVARRRARTGRWSATPRAASTRSTARASTTAWRPAGSSSSCSPTTAPGAGWPAVLRRHYGEAFSIARRLAGLLTLPRLLPLAGPVGMRSRALMTVALRVMGNLVTDEDRDVVARAWRAAGRLSLRLDERPPFT